MIDLGIVKPGSTIRIPFSSFDKDDGSAITMTNFAAADILIYKDGSTTERASTAGFTATTDFDAKTGKHLAVIDLADNTTAGFYSAGSEYLVAIDAVTVDAVTTGGWIARFIIGRPNADLNTTIATLASQTSFTLTAGPAEDDALNGAEMYAHDVASAVQAAYGTVLDYTGSTKTVTLATAPTFTMAATDNVCFFRPTSLMKILGTLLSTPATAGILDVNVKNIDNDAASASGTVTFPNATLASTTNISAGTITTATNVTTVNGLAAGVITAASIAADAITDAKVASDVTIASVTGAVGSVTGNVGGNVTGSVGTVNALAANIITAASIATDAAAEIADAVWDEATSGHSTAGTTGKALTDAGSAGDPWGTALPGAYGAGTAGKILGDNIPQTGDSYARIGAAGAGLTNINLPDQTMDIVGNITGNLSGSVGSVTGNVGGNVTGSVGTVNALAANVITAASLAVDAGAEIADAVWDEVTSGHTTAGTTGKALTDAGSAGDPWSTALPGAYGAGTAGKILGDNIPQTGDTYALANGANGFVATKVDTAAILVDTGTTLDARIPAALVGGRMDSSTGAMAANVMTAAAAAADLTTELQSGLATAAALDVVDNFLDTEIADIQARLPAALVGGRMDANMGAISSDSVAADNAEAFFDGTGYAGTGNVIPTVTTVGTVNALAANTITASALATDAVTEIQSGLATSAEVVAIQNNTSSVFTVPQFIERPDSGTTPREVHLYLYDGAGNMEAPDSAPTLTLVNQAGTDRSSRLDSATMALVAAGHYKVIYTASVGDTLEQLFWQASIVEGGVTRLRGGITEIVDTTAVDFTSADRAIITAVKAVTDLIPNAGAMTSLAQDSTVAKAAAISALNNISTAQVLAQVDAALDAANTEVTTVPAATGSLRNMLKYMFAWRRNKKTQTSTTMTLRNDADSGNIATSAISDDGTTLTMAEDA
jgi:hypothetical protein